MAEISEDLRDIVSTTLNSVKEGMKKEQVGVSGTIKFEVYAIKSKEAKGGLQFLFADASGNYTKESVCKITFETTGPVSDSYMANLRNQLSQLQSSLNVGNSKVELLNRQIQMLDKTITDQATILKKKDTQIEKLVNQTKQLSDELARAIQQKENVLSQFQQMQNEVEAARKALKENPRIIIK